MTSTSCLLRWYISVCQHMDDNLAMPKPAIVCHLVFPFHPSVQF